MEPIKWNDEKIEQHLKSLPPIKDRQSKQELYLKVEAKVEYKNNKGKRLPTWSLPALATACALVIFGVFAPELVKNGGTKEQNKVVQHEAKKESNEMNTTMTTDGEVSLKFDNKTAPVSYHGPIQESSLQSTETERDWVTVGYLDEQAQLAIPVSFITKPNQYLDKVNEQLQKFKPASAGLMESPLQRAKITEEEETVIIDWPAGSIYEAEEPLLKNLIALTFSNENQKYKVEFRTEGKTGYEFPNYGLVKGWNLEVPGAPHFRYDAPTTDTFIVSLFSAGQEADDMPADLDDALEVMDEEQERGLKPLLPKNLELEVKITGKHSVEITFPDSFKLQPDNQEHQMMIDAILLTAKSYDYDTVKFNNTGLEAIGPYQLNKPIEGIKGQNVYHYQ
ncbi:hypothetical protein [Fictibacillus phosphorivorans]|uniref:hypothetical protein n=1 Tax=Fictibacillus phosphorivorans TaxID=1221500 RepID=UPI002040C2A8|nr:hypothetical protein [Fictibacillus phosphorivorans]MCM3719415.1 hypothetical protein [Fictibacillus phosphorivorans]MCM3777107.1 hypothetical protein [Fictibacillus phosphorivorans]